MVSSNVVHDCVVKFKLLYFITTQDKNLGISLQNANYLCAFMSFLRL